MNAARMNRCNKMQPRMKGTGEPSSMKLMAMVNDFIESGGATTANCAYEIKGEACTCTCQSIHSLEAIDCDPIDASVIKEVKHFLEEASNGMDMELARHVERVSLENTADMAKWRRWLCERLARAGYDVAICKSEGIPLPLDEDGAMVRVIGGHEYVDVVLVDGEERRRRVVLEPGFRQQFEVVRSSATYRALVAQLPTTFVGEEHVLGQLLDTLCTAMRTTLCAHGLSIPPWRTFNFFHAKWFTPYTRLPHHHVSPPLPHPPLATHPWEPPPLSQVHPPPPPSCGALSQALSANPCII